MEKMLTVEDLKNGLAGLLIAARGPEAGAFPRGSMDSREVSPGDLFFALRGERQDAHDFLPQAFAAGAAGAVVSRPVDAPEDKAVFQVPDALTGLQRVAASLLAVRRTKVIGITGSVGKTTAKEVIASVLSRRYSVLKTQANLNTEIGVPLTILGLEETHERAVLELGMYVPGDIALLAEICKPSVGVVTNVAPVHLERVGSIGRITGGKAELVEALPADGLAVLNGDDPRVAAMARRTRARSVLYGLSEQCDVRGMNVVSRGLEGFDFTLTLAGQKSGLRENEVRIHCALPGRHHVYPALAAAAVALEDGMSPSEIAEALGEVRLELRLTVRPGPSGSTIIDDSYNASPPSMLAALDLLSETPGRHVALLGHMRELGAAETVGHRRVGQHTVGRCDVLFVAGDDATVLAEAALTAGHQDVRRISPEDAGDVLRDELRAGDYCLIKASRAVGLESVAEALVAR
jgi:UDP-N-acetylmuramoyl-tripeptide--D-alanyl-D-alanine ligase